MTTYTLTQGTTVLTSPVTEDVVSVIQTGVTLEIVVPDSTGSMRYTVNPPRPGDGAGDETIDITMDDYNVRLNGMSVDAVGSSEPELAIFEVTWLDGTTPRTSTVLLLWVENDNVSGGGSYDADYIFVLDGAPLPILNTPTDWENFDAQIIDITVPTGPYGPNTDIPLTSLGADVSENDMIYGSNGKDVFDGGAGNDEIFGYGGNDILRGSQGDDLLVGDNGNDRLFGGDGDDSLVGGSGKDRLFGGNGNDYLSGGNGDDVLNAGDNLGGSSGWDTVMAGKGNDTVDFSDMIVGYGSLAHDDLNRRIVVNIDGDANTGSINKGQYGETTLINIANPILSGQTTGGLGISGTARNDVFNISFSEGWMSLAGGAGNDRFNLAADIGAVRIDYRAADHGVTVDLATGVASDDGFGDVDTFVGAGKVREIRSTMMDDTITGSNANESFILMAGNDTLDAGGGYDRLRYDRYGVDGVEVNLQAGTGTGMWRGDAFTHTISNVEDLRGSNGNDTLTGANGQKNRIDGKDGNDVLKGGNRADTLLGDAGNDKINGRGGHDYINGGDGNDRLTGAAGNDTMLGGRGRDTLNGGNGDDTMTGNGGADRFVFSKGNDTITDFTSADKIDLSGVNSIKSFNDLRNNHTEDVGGNLVIDDNNGNTLTLIGVTEASLEANDFIF